MIIELIEKKDRCRRLTNYRRPITLLNVGLKNLSKAFSEKLKEVFPSSFSSQQTVYLKNSHNVESGRLISDIIETAPLNNLEGFLVEMDTEKTFESLDHTFLVSILKKYGLGQNFIPGIKILIKNQESWVLIGGKTTN